MKEGLCPVKSILVYAATYVPKIIGSSPTQRHCKCLGWRAVQAPTQANLASQTQTSPNQPKPTQASKSEQSQWPRVVPLLLVFPSTGKELGQAMKLHSSPPSLGRKMTSDSVFRIHPSFTLTQAVHPQESHLYFARIEDVHGMRSCMPVLVYHDRPGCHFVCKQSSRLQTWDCEWILGS